MSDELELFAVHCGGERGDMSVFDPFHPELGRKVVLPYFVYVVTHPDGVVLFDTGGHPDLISDPHRHLGPIADSIEVLMEPGDAVVDKLAEVGLKPRDIRHVVLSHLHYDHAGGIAFFPDATFHLQRRELELARHPPIYQAGLYVSADFEHPVTWNLIDGELDLFDDGRLLLFPTPGHTRGHQSMLVRLDEEPVILVADAAAEPRNVSERILTGIVASPDDMIASFERLERMADEEGATLLFTHDLAWPQMTKVAPGRSYR